MEGPPSTRVMSKLMGTNNLEKGGKEKNHKEMQKQQSLKERDLVLTLCTNKVKSLCLTKHHAMSHMDYFRYGSTAFIVLLTLLFACLPIFFMYFLF